MKVIRDARDQRISKYLDKSSEVVRIETIETEIKEAKKSLDGKNMILTKELADSREQEKKLKTELVDMTNRYKENKYEIEVIYEDNSSADKQFQIAQEAATERIKGCKITFRSTLKKFMKIIF